MGMKNCFYDLAGSVTSFMCFGLNSALWVLMVWMYDDSDLDWVHPYAT